MHALGWTCELGNKWEIGYGVLKRRRGVICEEVEEESESGEKKGHVMGSFNLGLILGLRHQR